MHGKKSGAKFLALLIGLLVLIFVINQPTEAANTASEIGNWLDDAGNGLGTFLSAVFN